MFYIELNAFYGLNNVLQVLYLQNNHLTELYQNNLDNLQQLKYINFDIVGCILLCFHKKYQWL